MSNLGSAGRQQVPATADNLPPSNLRNVRLKWLQAMQLVVGWASIDVISVGRVCKPKLLLLLLLLLR